MVTHKKSYQWYNTVINRPYYTVTGIHKRMADFADILEGGSQEATMVVVVVGISSLKIPKAFLIRSGAQRNFAF